MSEMYKFHNPERIYFTSSTIIRRIDFLTLNEYQQIVVDSNQLNHVDDGSGGIGYYRAEVVIVGDYYPFGMGIVGRSYSLKDYLFGFNGKENDNEIEGKGNWQDYEMRMYDPRVGRFASVDPLTKDYPWYCPYQFAGNKPVGAIDIDGLEEWTMNNGDCTNGPFSIGYAIANGFSNSDRTPIDKNKNKLHYFSE